MKTHLTLWTVKDVAEFLRLNPETVRAMTRRGELPAVKAGRVWRYFPDDIIAHLKRSPNHKKAEGDTSPLTLDT